MPIERLSTSQQSHRLLRRKTEDQSLRELTRAWRQPIVESTFFRVKLLAGVDFPGSSVPPKAVSSTCSRCSN